MCLYKQFVTDKVTVAQLIRRCISYVLDHSWKIKWFVNDFYKFNNILKVKLCSFWNWSPDVALTHW